MDDVVLLNEVKGDEQLDGYLSDGLQGEPPELTFLETVKQVDTEKLHDNTLTSRQLYVDIIYSEMFLDLHYKPAVLLLLAHNLQELDLLLHEVLELLEVCHQLH